MAKQYEVGYKKPPKAHQWQPGQSGNPSGKKRKVNKAAKAKSLSDYLVDELLEPVSPKVGGKAQQMPLVRFLAKSLLKDLIHAPPKEKNLLLERLIRLGVFDALETRIFDAQAEADSGSWLSEEERLMIAALNEAIDLDEGNS